MLFEMQFSPPPPAFTEHDGQYCATSGTGSKRTYDKKGGTLEACKDACVADAACACCDYSAAKKECRHCTAGAALKKTSTDYDAFVRN